MITGNHLNSNKLFLPLFLASRNRIKKYHFSVVRTYITKNAKNYNIQCFEDDDHEDAQKVEQSFGNNKKSKVTPSLYSKPIKNRRSEISWHLAPNRYNISNELGCSKKGIQWSHSKRTAQSKKDFKLQNTKNKFYEISANFFEKSKNTCNCHKGKFSTDPRNRRPSSRFMISNPVTCWRNKNDPGPTSYFVGIFERTSFPKITKKHVLPYKFLRYSCVPENPRLRLGDSSFSPGPGRYELLDDEQFLRLRLKILTQKRLQFRRLHFKHIILPKEKEKPDSVRWHIFGYGFTRLFRGSTITSKGVFSPKKSHRTGREIRMFPSFEYIKMITNPDRSNFSMRTEEQLETLSVLRFNCLVKFQKRRQLRDNKKVVFGSGVPRFKDSEMPIIRNQSKTLKLINFPVMTTNPKEIKSKLNDLPERLRGIYKSNRIQPFKFQPIPPVKLLLDKKEVHPEFEGSLEVYPKELNPIDFFKHQYEKI